MQVAFLHAFHVLEIIRRELLRRRLRHFVHSASYYLLFLTRLLFFIFAFVNVLFFHLN